MPRQYNRAKNFFYAASKTADFGTAIDEPISILTCSGERIFVMPFEKNFFVASEICIQQPQQIFDAFLARLEMPEDGARALMAIFLKSGMAAGEEPFHILRLSSKRAQSRILRAV
jgi:hypothetical protein